LRSDCACVCASESSKGSVGHGYLHGILQGPGRCYCHHYPQVPLLSDAVYQSTWTARAIFLKLALLVVSLKFEQQPFARVQCGTFSDKSTTHVILAFAHLRSPAFPLSCIDHDASFPAAVRRHVVAWCVSEREKASQASQVTVIESRTHVEQMCSPSRKRQKNQWVERLPAKSYRASRGGGGALAFGPRRLIQAAKPLLADSSVSAARKRQM